MSTQRYVAMVREPYITKEFFTKCFTYKSDTCGPDEIPFENGLSIKDFEIEFYNKNYITYNALFVSIKSRIPSKSQTNIDLIYTYILGILTALENQENQDH